MTSTVNSTSSAQRDGLGRQLGTDLWVVPEEYETLFKLKASFLLTPWGPSNA